MRHCVVTRDEWMCLLQSQCIDASKPTPIHPAVRKLLGKTVRAADVDLLLAEPSLVTTSALTTGSLTTGSLTTADGHVARTDHETSLHVALVRNNFHDWQQLCVLHRTHRPVPVQCLQRA